MQSSISVAAGEMRACAPLPRTPLSPVHLSRVRRPPAAATRRLEANAQAASSWASPARRRRRPVAAAGSGSENVSSSSGSSSDEPELLTFEEVQDIARARGLEISVRCLGPFWRIVCRDAAAPPPAAPGRRPSTLEQEAEEAGAGIGGRGRVLGVTNGFLIPAPVGVMHCDTLQVFTRGQKGEEGARTRGGVLGLGLLLGAATFSFGAAAGCSTAKILAINDDEAWHARLVGYYQRFGFQPVGVVSGSSLQDLPDMLMFGGAGTRMDADVRGMLRRWTRAVRRNSPAAAGSPAAAAGAAGVAAEIGAGDSGGKAAAEGSSGAQQQAQGAAAAAASRAAAAPGRDGA